MSSYGRNDTVEVDLHFHQELDASIKVSEDGDNRHAKFLPKSRIEFELSRDRKSVKVTMPAWLAEKEELI